MKTLTFFLLVLGFVIGFRTAAPGKEFAPRYEASVGADLDFFMGADAGEKEVSEVAVPEMAGLVYTDGEGDVLKRISTIEYLGREHFRIKTATATYYYDPLAGNFSAIIDKLGNDWVGLKADASPAYPAAAATAYRGVPQIARRVRDGVAGEYESRVTRRNQITTVSLSGEWEWHWTFYRNSARLDVIRAPEGKKYWFMYEGPAGGKYLPRSTFWATDLNEPSYEIRDQFTDGAYRGQHRYFFTGEDHNPYAFFMLQATSDTQPDHLSYLGNEEIGARDSPDGMLVAGFGRAAGAKPLLTGSNTFVIGLTRHNAADPLSVFRTRKRIEKIARKRGKVGEG